MTSIQLKSFQAIKRFAKRKGDARAVALLNMIGRKNVTGAVRHMDGEEIDQIILETPHGSIMLEPERVDEILK